MTLPVFLLDHLTALVLSASCALLALFAYMVGVHTGRTLVGRKHPGATGILIELGYIADIPIAYLVNAGDAVKVADWLDKVKEGVGIRA